MPDVEAPGHVQFGLVELDLLATYAGAEIPFPLRVPSFGEVPPARELLLASAGETLQLRGLADDDGPLELAEELATMLAGRSGAIDLVIGGPGWQSGAVALVDSRRAVLCLQRFNEAERDLVEVYPVETDSLAAELVRLVPGWPGGHSIPVRLPLRAVRAAESVLAEADPGSSDRAVVEQRVRAALRDGGVGATAAAKLVTVLSPLECYGQMGVTRPGTDGQDVRVGAELSWIDTPRGRYSIASTQRGAGDGSVDDGSVDDGSADDGWVSINPLHPEDLLGSVRGFVSAARR